MIVLPLLLFGTTLFIEQDLPGLHVDPPNPLTGKPSLQFLQADIDHDGFIDLVLPSKVIFQREGLFPLLPSVDLPIRTGTPECDIHEGDIYFRYPDTLNGFRWENGQWVEFLSQALSWTGTQIPPQEHDPNTNTAGEVTFSRFLHDLNQDGAPEIIYFHRDGLNIFAQEENTFVLAATHDIYPPYTPALPSATSLWPLSTRQLLYPPRKLMFQSVITDNTIQIITRHTIDDENIRYRIKSYSVDAEFNIKKDPLGTLKSAVLPIWMAPVDIDGKPPVDFVGARSSTSTSSSFPTPLFETMLSVDAGTSTQSFRAKSFRPRCSFIDFDSDNDQDLIVESTGLTDGGLRESLNRFFFQRIIEHSVSVHLQDDTGVFSRRPFTTRKFPIHLKKPPFRDGEMFRRYAAGDLVDVTGDFNGDGRRDLVVQDALDRVIIYFSRPLRFSKRPVHIITIRPSERFYVADIDTNGLSDLILVMPDEESGAELVRVLFAKETDQ